MAEVVGTFASAVAIAGLFKACVEAFDCICTAKNQSRDLKRLTLKLNIEKCRLYTWGLAMGLSQVATSGQTKPLDACPFQELVREILEQIMGLFTDSHTIKDKYGCRQLPLQSQLQLGDDTGPKTPLDCLNASFDDFKTLGTTKLKQSNFVQKGIWVIHDRKKFGLLISESKNLIDGLQDITKDLISLAQQETMIRSRIITIGDLRTLDMVAEVCEVDHPRISDAASTKADAVSLSCTIKHDVSRWTETIDGEFSDVETIEETIEEMESWNITELKHELFSLLRNRAQGEQNKAEYSKSLLEQLRDSLPSEEMKAQRRASQEKEGEDTIDDLKMFLSNVRLKLIPSATLGIISLDDENEETRRESSGLSTPKLTALAIPHNEESLPYSRGLDVDIEEEVNDFIRWFRILTMQERGVCKYLLDRKLSEEEIEWVSSSKFAPMTLVYRLKNGLAEQGVATEAYHRVLDVINE